MSSSSDTQLAVNQQLAQAIQVLALTLNNHHDDPQSEPRRRAKKPELPEFDGQFGTFAKD